MSESSQMCHLCYKRDAVAFGPYAQGDSPLCTMCIAKHIRDGEMGRRNRAVWEAMILLLISGLLVGYGVAWLVLRTVKS